MPPKGSGLKTPPPKKTQKKEADSEDELVDELEKVTEDLKGVLKDVKKKPLKKIEVPDEEEAEEEAEEEDEEAPAEDLPEAKKKSSGIDKAIQGIREKKGLGLVDIGSTYDTIIKFLPEIFNKSGDGKFTEEFILRPGIDRSPPHIYTVAGGPKEIFKPRATKNSKWLCFVIGDYIKTEKGEDVFFELSAWETQDEAVDREKVLRKELKGKVQFFESKCGCKKELNFLVELTHKPTTKKIQKLFNLYELTCPCTKKLKVEKEGESPLEAEKTPTKKSPSK